MQDFAKFVGHTILLALIVAGVFALVTQASKPPQICIASDRGV